MRTPAIRVPRKFTRGTREPMHPRTAWRRSSPATAASPAFGGRGPGGATGPGTTDGSGGCGPGGSTGTGSGGLGALGQSRIVEIESSSVTVVPPALPLTVAVLSTRVGSQAAPPASVRREQP